MPQPPTHFPEHLWHNEVHQVWADDRLIFLLFAYEPTYNRERARQRLIRFFEDRDVRSYQMYELTSSHDILVRAWVPSRTRLPLMKRELIDEDQDRRLTHLLEVEEIVHHWPWAPRKDSPIGQMRSPVDVGTRRPVRELDLVNASQREPGLAASDRKVAQLLRQFRCDRLIVKPVHRQGIRFLILVKVTQEDNWEELQHQVGILLGRARRTIRDVSLYRIDDKTQFLILGRVLDEPGAFHHISSKLVAPINNYAASGAARTYTLFFAMPGFLAFKDEVRTPAAVAPAEEPSAAELLQRPEGERLEVKGSAFTELDHWLRGTVEEPRTSRKPLTDYSNEAVNGVLLGVAALLNTSGGHVVIGALEKSKYKDLERFDGLPAVNGKGPWRCCGIELDFGDGDWDDFARKLRDLIEHRFDPVPSPRWVRIRPCKVGDKPMCVIDVAVPDEWFWVKAKKKGGGREDKFVVRVEGRTRMLTGRAMDKHKSRFPRSSPLP